MKTYKPGNIIYLGSQANQCDLMVEITKVLDPAGVYEIEVVNGAWDGTLNVPKRTLFIHYTKATIPAVVVWDKLVPAPLKTDKVYWHEEYNYYISIV